MPIGFFSTSELSRMGSACTPGPPNCGRCGLYRTCSSPRMPVTGEGRRGVLVVAEAPGEVEDRRGVQLMGPAGEKMRERLDRIGVNLDRDCWKTNALACRPPDNAKPTPRQVESCRPAVMRAIADLRPRVVLLCGEAAVESVVGAVWRKSGGIGAVGRWVGWQIPSGRWGAWVCPTWHPSYLLHDRSPVLELLFDKHLSAAFGVESEPWPFGQMKWENKVERVWEPGKAAAVLDRMREKGGTVAFDYETNMLKPDSPYARIASCAVCWEGKKTIAYPWVGEAIAATGRLLHDPNVGKICWGIKFEERWTRRAFGRGIENCMFCGMHAAHVLDNRPGITGLKFQSFVRLGVEPYDEDVEQYLKAEKDGGNEQNRIDRADVAKLLLYNGMDALLTWELSRMQMEEIGL